MRSSDRGALLDNGENLTIFAAAQVRPNDINREPRTVAEFLLNPILIGSLIAINGVTLTIVALTRVLYGGCDG